MNTSFALESLLYSSMTPFVRRTSLNDFKALITMCSEKNAFDGPTAWKKQQNVAASDATHKSTFKRLKQSIVR